MNRSIRNIFLIILALTVWLGGQSATAETIKVSISGSFEEIKAVEHNNIVFFSLSELVPILGGSLDWNMVGHSVVYEHPNGRFDIIIGSPYFKLRDTLYNITYPVEFKDGQIFMPAKTFIPFLDRIVSQKLTWDPNSRVLRVDSDYFNVTDIAFFKKSNGLLIELYLTNALAYEIFVTEGNWLNVNMRNARLNRSRIQSRYDPQYMYRLKTHQVGQTGQVSVRLKRNIESWTHKLVFDPPRIQISIADSDFSLDPGETTMVVGPDDKIDVIVIDPGHGGSDYGAIGQQGSREKDVVLGIAKDLANLIRKDKEFKVILTRDRDKYVSLEERAKIANKAGADLFVSIHANASPKRHVRGWNVFFLAPAKNDSAREVEQFENSFFLRELNSPQIADKDDPGIGVINPVNDILNQMIMTEFQSESHDFAMMVDREFRRVLKTPARGVDQAGFFVLNKVFTPSVLIESAFISNSTEEKLLRSKDFQEDVAQGLYRAIKRFKAKYEK